MNRQAFLKAYRAELIARYPWADNVDQLNKFMASVERTVSSSANTWHYVGDATIAAWRTIGGKGRPTLTGLRSLSPI